MLSLVVMPWKIYSSPVAVNYFLGALGAFMGPLFGIIIIDYYVVRKRRIPLADLYKIDGAYSYRSGTNVGVIAAFAIASAIAAPLSLINYFATVSPFAWPIGVVLGAAIYFALTRGQQIVGTTPAEESAAMVDATANPRSVRSVRTRPRHPRLLSGIHGDPRPLAPHRAAPSRSEHRVPPVDDEHRTGDEC